MAVDWDKVDIVTPKKKGKTLKDIRREKVSPLSKAEFIEQRKFDPIGQLGMQARRKGAFVAKGLIGDIPFIRKILPKSFEDIKPRSRAESLSFAIPKFTRDVTALSKVAPLKGAKFLLGAGGFGAATAGTEKPIGIAKSAATSAALFKGIDVGFKVLPGAVRFAYEKLPKFIRDPMLSFGRSIGTSLKKYTDITKAQFKRHADIKVKQIETAQFANEMKEALPNVADREALAFMIEKTSVPSKLQRPDIIKSLQSDKMPIMKDWANKLRQRYDSAKDAMIDTYGKDTAFVQNYVNRLWDIPKNKEKQVVSWFMRKSSHSQKRTISTLQEGINKFGLTPRKLDAAELISYYENNVYTAMANENFVKAVSNMKIGGKTVKLKNGKVKIVGGTSMIQRADKAPGDWIKIDHPSINRAMGRTGKDGKLIITKVPVKVHPEIAEEMKSIFGAKNETEVVRLLETINSYGKHSNLALSLFHHIALLESGVATGINAPKIFLESVRQMKQGKSPVLNNPAFKDAVAHNLIVEAPSDVSRNLVEKSLLGLNERLGKQAITKPLKLVTKPAQWIVNTNNTFLWDYLHPNLKLFGYEKGVHSILKSKQFQGVPIDEVKRSVATIINDTFGGQAFELLTKSPQWRQSMQFAFLSPDWGISTMRQFGSIFGAGGRSATDNAIRKELGSEFWKMGGIIMYGAVNQLNRAFTEIHLGKARNMWENEPGKKARLFIGKNPDGSNEYMRTGKQFLEVPEMFMLEGQLNPPEATLSKLTGKASPLVHAISAQVFPNRFSKIPESEGFEKTGERLKQAAKFGVPFSVQSNVRKGLFDPLSEGVNLKTIGKVVGKVDPLTFAFPISKGMNFFSAKKELTRALKSKSKKRVLETMSFISENGHNVLKIFAGVKKDIMKKRGTKEWKEAQKIFESIVTSKNKMSKLQELKASGKINEDIEKKVIKIMQEQIEAKKQYEAIGASQ